MSGGGPTSCAYTSAAPAPPPRSGTQTTIMSAAAAASAAAEGEGAKLMDSVEEGRGSAEAAERIERSSPKVVLM